LAFGRKKKRGKWDGLLIALAMVAAFGVTLTACDAAQTAFIGTDEYDITVVTAPQSNGEVAFSATIQSNVVAGAK
jgi:hypothetical protein